MDAKTDDHFFLGFPSYFNVVAFYAIVFEPGPRFWPSLLVVCSLLVFVPIRYVYPTRTVAFRRLSLTLTALWLVSYAVILFEMPEPDPLILGFSILYLVYYFGLSLYLSAKSLEARRVGRGESTRRPSPRRPGTPQHTEFPRTEAKSMALNEALLKRLIETPGVPGREEQQREIAREELGALTDEVRTDSLGSVIGTKKGSDEDARVMVAAHTDEIGFLVKYVDEKGFLRLADPWRPRPGEHGLPARPGDHR